MKIQNLLTIFLITLALTGCGKTYQNEFKNWLGIKFAKETPFKLASLKTKNIEASGNELIFQFEGNVEVLEDLYIVVPALNFEGIREARNSARAAVMTDAQINKLERRRGKRSPGLFFSPASVLVL